MFILCYLLLFLFYPIHFYLCHFMIFLAICFVVFLLGFILMNTKRDINSYGIFWNSKYVIFQIIETLLSHSLQILRTQIILYFYPFFFFSSFFFLFFLFPLSCVIFLLCIRTNFTLLNVFYSCLLSHLAFFFHH